MTLNLSKLETRPTYQKMLLAFILGLLLAATLAPVHFIFLLPVCFTGLLLILDTAKTKKQAFFMGWFFGWGLHIAGLYWIGVAFTIDAQAHAALIPVPTLILPAFLGIFSGLTTLAVFLARTNGSIKVLTFSAVWVFLEYIRGILFTGFPWNLIGYAWGDVLPILQITSVIGAFGLTVVTIAISATPYLLFDPKLSSGLKNGYILGTCSLLIGIYIFGIIRLQAPELDTYTDEPIRIVQPNNDQETKWKQQTRFSHVKRLYEISDQPDKNYKHLIWPETAVPFFLGSDDRLRFYLKRLLPENGTLITGAPRKDPNVRKYWNSVIGMDATGTINHTYDKRHLLPYGEYLPLRGFLEKSGISSLIPALDNMSDFSFPNEGASNVVSFGSLPSARVLICYEVTFPWEVRDQTPFKWILNVTNDAWFGHTSGPYQHFVISKTRAIEQGVSLIRSANKGISGIIDGYGRVLHEKNPTETGYIDGFIPKPLSEQTLYARFGESISFFLLCLMLTPLLIQKIRLKLSQS